MARDAKLDLRLWKDNGHGADFMQGSEWEKETALREEEEKKKHGGSQVFGETSKRAISPLQMRLFCQVQGYYDAAEQSPLKQGALYLKRDRSKGARQCPFFVSSQTI